MILILTVITICLPFLLLYFEKHIKREGHFAKNRIVSFLLEAECIEAINSLLLTIAGVTLAILLTNFDSEAQDRLKTIELLSTLESELQMTQENIEVFYIPMLGKIDVDEESQECIEMYKAVPLVRVFTIDAILENELVVTNMNPYSYKALIDVRRSIIMSFDRLDTISNDSELVNELKMLNNSISLMRKIITVDISFQEGKLPQSQMKSIVNKQYENMFLGQ